MDALEITQPDDWHVHLRDGAALALTVNATARVFARAIVMPNLAPPITTAAAAHQYRERILAALKPLQAGAFEPLMTLYLTDNTVIDEIDLAKASPHIAAVKLYPAGATTNSDFGVTEIERCYGVFERMTELDLPLSIHGEVVDAEVDIFDREAIFIDTVLAPLQQRFPSLRIILEHITTADAVAFVESAPPQVAATITPHHLLLDRNDMLAGGIRPHYYCLPVLKRRRHQQALLRAATGGNPRFFLGTDSAPHPLSAKESPCGCAGIYSAHAAIELYAEVFDRAGRLEGLENFASHFGADFYRCERNVGRIRLQRETWTAPNDYAFGDERLKPLRAGESLLWRVVN